MSQHAIISAPDMPSVCVLSCIYLFLCPVADFSNKPSMSMTYLAKASHSDMG